MWSAMRVQMPAVAEVRRGIGLIGCHRRQLGTHHCRWLSRLSGKRAFFPTAETYAQQPADQEVGQGPLPAKGRAARN